VANHLAIATITATLQRMLQESVQMDVEGARVTTIRPSDIGNGTPETGVNLFMYQVVSNPALNNIDATPARSRGNPIRR
jgi:Pvc16 N-terminal domain